MTEKISPIERTILEKESSKRGGMLVLIWGEQGSMKTMSMVRMVMFDMGVDNVGDSFDKQNVRRIPVWKAQRSCQWILLAAQGLPITLWMHEKVNSYQFKLTGSRRAGIKSRKIEVEDMEGIDIEVKTFETPEELVDRLEPDRVNCYFVPGSGGSEKDKYFYQRFNCSLSHELNERDYGDHITLNLDEVQNEAPDKTNGDFYELQMSDFPSEWEDFRKNRISLRGTGHSHNEVNWKLHKNKVTGTVYMRKAQVHSRHKGIKQREVNRMSPGDFVIPGFQPGSFDMPLLPKDVFDWFPSHEDVRLKMDVDYSLPDTRPNNIDVEKWIDSQPFDKRHLEDIIDVGEAASMTPWTSREIRRKVSTGSLEGVKVLDKWLLSQSALINNEDVPIE